MVRIFWTARFVAVFACFLAALCNPVFSQSSLQTDPSLQPMIDAARQEGVRVIVIDPDVPPARTIDPTSDVRASAARLRTQFRQVVRATPDFFANIMKTLSDRSPDGSSWWLWRSLLIATGGLLLGRVLAVFLSRWSRENFRDRFDYAAKNRADKIGYLMFRAFLALVISLIMVATAALVALIFDSGHDASYGTIGVIIVCTFTYVMFRYVVFSNLIAADVPSHRMLAIDDEAANKMLVEWPIGVGLVVALCGFFMWLFLLGTPAPTLKLLVIIALGLSALIIATLVLRHHKSLRDIVLGESPSIARPWRKFLASNIHRITVAYLFLAWIFASARVLLDQPNSLAVIGAPAVAIVGAVGLYGLLILIIDRFYRSRKQRYLTLAKEAERKANLEIVSETTPVPENNIDDGQEYDVDLEDDREEEKLAIMAASRQRSELETMPAFKPVFKTLLEKTAGIVSLLAAIAWILDAWQVQTGGGTHPIAEFRDTLFILFLGWFAYQAAAVYFRARLEEEGLGEGSDDTGALIEGEGGGAGVSRLGTLLPLVRNVILVVIVIFSAMLVLSNAGVNIAPLFAGAGVIGLAVGFGAQTLIRDIFSGGFFLFDDAFRKGEYIELGDIRGTVEKISLRSFQLRHHNGPLHTIPFGEITQLTNYSRDWVMMKLPLRLTYDTDVERVRKLIKKLGQSLLDHPEVGHLFLQPLKSQGVYAMEDSAMIMRVKFMTKPGDQFVTRKVVYAAIRDLFEAEGIRFANREVTVRLAEEPVKPLTDTEKTAIASAAQSAIEAEVQGNDGGKQTESR